MADNKILIELDIGTPRITQSFENIENEAQKSGIKAAVKFTDEFGKFVKSNLFDTAKDIALTTASFFALGAIKDAFKGSVVAAKEFEKSILAINSILPNNTELTERQIKALKQLSIQYGTTAKDQAEAFYQVVSAGITNTVEATKLLSSANKLAIGGVANLQGSIDVLTSIVNGYGKENITAQEAADSLFTTVRVGKTTIDELNTRFGLLIPSAVASGISLDEVSAAVASLTQKGFETNLAITRLNSLFAAFARNGDLLGSEMSVTALKTDGLVKVLERLDEKTKGSSTEMFRLLGSQEAVQAAQTLSAKGARDLALAYQEFTDKAGAATKAFNKIAESASFKFDQLKAQIENLSITVGARLLPEVLKTAQGMASLFGLTSGESTALSELNSKLSDTRKELNFFIDRQQELQKQKQGLFGFMVSNEEITQITPKINELKQKISELLVQRAELLNTQPAQEAVQANNQILQTSTIAAQESLMTWGQAFSDAFTFAEDKTLSLQDQIKSTNELMKKFAKDSAASLRDGLARGAGQAFAAFGKAIATGEDALSSFAKALFKSIADQAVALGTNFILTGTAMLFSPNPADNAKAPFLIKSGAALAAFGGFMGGLSGGGAGGAASGGTQGNTGIGEGNIPVTNEVASPDIEQERVQPGTNVQVVVQGSLVQQEELGEFITRTLNESFGKQGVTLTDARFA